MLAGAVALAGVAAVLAASAGPDAPVPPAAVPTVPAGPPAADPGLPIVDVAVGARSAYALLGVCGGPEQARTCSYRLSRRDPGGAGWASRPLPPEALATAGFSARLFVSGTDGLVTVVDAPNTDTAFVTADGGASFAVRLIRPGPPIAAVPPEGILELGTCQECADRLTVLDPATGLLRPLAAQPSLGPGVPVRTLTCRGDVIWSVGAGRNRAASAVSTDRGRSWRTVPLPGLRTPVPMMRMAATAAGGAYLLVGRDSRPDVLNEFSELWSVDRPGGSWRPVDPGLRPRSAVSLVAGRRGLLVSEESGTVWRLRPGGSMSRLPDPVVDGQPHGPGRLVGGTGPLVLATPVDGPLPQTVLTSVDGGESWRAERLPR